MSNSKRTNEGVNTGSMADIAFLLLIFFLVTTQIATDKGLQLRLPPLLNQPPLPMHERNILKIQVNAQNAIMVEGEELKDLESIQNRVIEFVLNNARNSALSDSPKKAVVSIKTDRATDYKTFVAVLDKVHGAYYTMRGKQVGLSAEEFRSLDKQNPRDRDLYDKGRAGLPMQISIAEPSNVKEQLKFSP